MGEAKRKQAKLSPAEREGIRITHKLANEGKLVEGGFAAWCLHRKVDPFTAASKEFSDIYDAYMSGAEHLWTSIMATLDPGADETPADLHRFDLIHKELDEWRELKMAAMARAYPTKGSA